MILEFKVRNCERGQSMKAEAFVCIPHVKDKGTAVDVEILPLVQCKDCKHCYVDGENVRFNVCELDHNKVQSGDWFCADGERKEG